MTAGLKYRWPSHSKKERKLSHGPDWLPCYDRHFPQLPCLTDVTEDRHLRFWRDLDRAEAFGGIRKPHSTRRMLTDLDAFERALRSHFERDERERAMFRLEDAANARDTRTFLNALGSMRWEDRSSKDWVRATRLALEAGAHSAARRIATEGARLHPGDSELQKYARVLALPTVVSKKVPSDPTRRANREWLKVHSGEYRGRWVAIRAGELLAAARSLGELREHLVSTEGVLLTKAA